MNSYTNISIFGYDLIVQKLNKPFEVRIAIKKVASTPVTTPSDKSLEKILYYLGEEGFLDDGKDEEGKINLTHLESESKMKLAVGYLPSHKFKQLKHKLEQHG